MSKKYAQSELMPRLRFPEFQAADGWTPELFGTVVSLEYGSSLPEKNRSGDGFPVVGSNGVVGYHDTATVTGPTIVVGRKGSVGQINLIQDDCTPIDTTFYVVSKRPKRDDFYFIWRLLESSQLDAFSDSGAVPGLNRNDVLALQTALPEPAEQQKIAECLGSLDDLIAAKKQKLAALRAYKKGLMQQLFPRKGETLPRLRFRAFRDAGEWVNCKIGEILAKRAETAALDDKGIYREIGVRSHGKGLFHKKPTTGKVIGAKRVFHVVPDALVINIVFAWEQALAVTTLDEEGFIASHRFPMFVPIENRCDVRFIQRLFLMPLGKELLKIASPGGAGRNRTLSQKEFENLDVLIPEIREQHRIADCLCVLDDLITAQAEKLCILRSHKRGLMQQLFPSPVK